MKLAASLLMLAMAGLSHSSLAADDGDAAISAIGKLNGIALACQQPAIVTRTRNAVQTTAPKTRANGEVFEAATNAAYLEQGKGLSCPDAATLSKRVGDAEKQLQAAFPASQ
jgi:hypothetical protein